MDITSYVMGKNAEKYEADGELENFLLFYNGSTMVQLFISISSSLPFHEEILMGNVIRFNNLHLSESFYFNCIDSSIA